MVAPELKHNADNTEITKTCAVLGCDDSKNLSSDEFFRYIVKFLKLVLVLMLYVQEQFFIVGHCKHNGHYNVKLQNPACYMIPYHLQNLQFEIN